MARRSLVPPVLVSVLAVLAAWNAAPAYADDMDISLARLRVPTTRATLPTGCSASGANGVARDYCPDNEAWGQLMSQLGGSMIPPVVSPARTVGYGGLYLGLEGWLTGINSGSNYWRLGTEGDSRAGAEVCPSGDTGLGCNRFPSGSLIWSRVAVRKGFPFGIEIGTSFAHLITTNLWSWGLEFKWALFEGYRTGLGILPDVAVRGMVQTMVGDSQFNLTIPALDVVISKPLVIESVGAITPFISGQVAWIFADSELVDLTPDVDAFDECRPDPTVATTTCARDTGSDPIPSGRVPGQDFNNNATFKQLRFTRTRLTVGAQGRYEAITLTASFAFDLSKPPDADDDAPAGLPRQWTAAAGAGITF